MEQKDLYSLLERIASGISEMFGDNCETVIIDFNKINNPIVAINNGHVTSRKIGDSVSELGLKALADNKLEESLINYYAKTKDGRLIKCSTFNICSSHYRYSLGINFDCTYLTMAIGAMEDLIKTSQSVEDKFYDSSDVIIKEMIADAINYVGVSVSLMKKKDRIKAVKYLKDRGAFAIQRGVQIIASALHVSRYTVYNYIKELNRS